MVEEVSGISQVYSPPVLASRVLPDSRAVTAALVVASALLTALCAQIEIPLPFTPVPITGQTFAVLLSGAVLGMRAGAAGQALYVALGAVGLPFYAGGGSGLQHVTGATGGYLVGFVVAAALVGRLAERRNDRRVRTALPLFLAGNLVIYLLGVPWLAVVAGFSVPEALAKGALPFLVGDLLKILLAGLILPGAWRLLEHAQG